MTTQPGLGNSDAAVVPIACTLEGGDVARRVDEWQSLLASVTDRTELRDGIRLTFPPDISAADIAGLAAAEQACCSFLSFSLTIDSRGTALEVRAPDQAADVITALFGVAARAE